MRGFIRNCKGAVTVFVTLLLIPTILVTGTGVDIARIYTARSAVRDANQLAANSALTYYDSLLQDLYGLFAVMRSDDELAGMLDTYIRASLFNEDVTDAQYGEFRLFSQERNTNIEIEGLDKLSNNSNVQVLRRQIEEYAKWRAPVAIVIDIIDRFRDNEVFEKADADSDALRDIAEIEDKTEKIIEVYSKIYNEIEQLKSEYNLLENTVFANLNEYIGKISGQINELLSIRDDYQKETDHDKKDDLRNHYIAVMRNIENLVKGTGTVGSRWNKAHYDNNGNYIEGKWDSTVNAGSGFQSMIDSNVGSLRSFESKFTSLLTLSRQADQAKTQLETAIKNLENKLDANSGSYTDGLADGIKEDLEVYKEWIKHNYENLAIEMKDKNTQAIESGAVKVLTEIQAYGRVENNRVVSPLVSFNNLRSLINNDIFPIGFNGNDSDDLLKRLNNAGGWYYSPGSFIPFNDVSEAHKQAYEALKKVPGALAYSGSSEETKGKAEEGSLIDNFKKYMSTLGTLTGLSSNNTGGADRYASGAVNKPIAYNSYSGMTLFNIINGGFDSSTNTSSDNHEGFLGMVRKLMSGNANISTVLGNALDGLANKALLVAYCSNMFTNYTTNLPEPENYNDVAMSGHTFSPDINYFYRSEVEFIIAGHDTAMKNLQSVSFMIFTIRIISNLVASFAIRELNKEINTMKQVIGCIPVVGKFLMWLVRPLYIFCESVDDLTRLRNGEEVSLVKSKETWRFWITGVAGAGTGQADEKFAIYYRDYLTIFMLVGNADTLAGRAGNLIMLNVTNVRHNVGPNHEIMEALLSTDMCDFAKGSTTFKITTATDLRLIFLSLGYAQNGNWVNARPPSAFPVRQTDYRGY